MQSRHILQPTMIINNDLPPETRLLWVNVVNLFQLHYLDRSYG